MARTSSQSSSSSYLLQSLSKLQHKSRCTAIDLIFFSFAAVFLLFLLLALTPLGDPLAATGHVTLSRSRSPSSSIRQQQQIISLIDSGGDLKIEECSMDEVDQMPCEDPRRNSQLSREMNFYRERHCPLPGESPLCLVPPPNEYRIPIPWPNSLHKIWHGNTPYDKIADRKGHQGWMKKEGPYFIFPGGGTMFPDGAVEYIEKVGQHIPINEGTLRTALDMGCGVASFGGFLLKKNITTLSFAPRDSHKAQIQFVLERGIPAFVAMLGTRRLPFPAFSFDLVHCSRCLIPFTAYNGSYIIEVDRLLRPGGYLVISGPPVQWHKQEKEWGELQAAAKALCYKLINVEGNTVIWKKPSEATCFPNKNVFGFGLCTDSDDPSDAWYFKLKTCVSNIPSMQEVAIESIPKWPQRLSKPPARVSSVLEDGATAFEADAQLWAKRVVYYKDSLGLKLGTPKIRNIIDMNAHFGGFAAALQSDPVWVMNVVPSHKPRTLDVIYDRGLVGVYHDWCEAFSTYPRNDFIHAVEIDSLIKDSWSGKSRCHLVNVMVEMDRILRPEGTVVIRDSPVIIDKVVRIANAIRWKLDVHESEPESNQNERIVVATKTFWKSSQ